MEYTENYFKSIDKAMEDEDFVGKLAKAESKEQIQELFQQEKGIVLESEPAQAAFDKVESVKKSGELSAEDLENVAGGCWRCAFVRSGASTGASWGTQLWGSGFGTMFGAIIGAQIARNILSGRF